MLARKGKENSSGKSPSLKLHQPRNSKVEKGNENARKPLKDVQAGNLSTKPSKGSVSNDGFEVDPISYQDIMDCKEPSQILASRSERATVGIVDSRREAELARRIPRSGVHAPRSSLYAKTSQKSFKSANPPKNNSDKCNDGDGSFLQRPSSKLPVPIPKAAAEACLKKPHLQDFEIKFEADPIALESILNGEGLAVDIASNQKRASSFGPVKRQSIKGRIAPFVKPVKRLAQVNAILPSNNGQVAGIRRGSLYQRDSFNAKLDLQARFLEMINGTKSGHAHDTKPFLQSNVPSSTKLIPSATGVDFASTCVGFQDDLSTPSLSRSFHFGKNRHQLCPTPSTAANKESPTASNCTLKIASTASHVTAGSSIKSILKQSRGGQKSEPVLSTSSKCAPVPCLSATRAASVQPPLASAKTTHISAFQSKGYDATPVRARRNLQLGLPLPMSKVQTMTSPLGCVPLDDTDLHDVTHALQSTRPAKSVRWAERLTVETEESPEYPDNHEDKHLLSEACEDAVSSSTDATGQALRSPPFAYDLSPRKISGASVAAETPMTWQDNPGGAESSAISHHSECVAPAEQPHEISQPPRVCGDLPAGSADVATISYREATDTHGDTLWLARGEEGAPHLADNADFVCAPAPGLKVADVDIATCDHTYQTTNICHNDKGKRKFRCSILERIYGSPDPPERSSKSNDLDAYYDNILVRIYGPSIKLEKPVLGKCSEEFPKLPVPSIAPVFDNDPRCLSGETSEPTFVPEEPTLTGLYRGPLQSTMISEGAPDGDFLSYRSRLSPGKVEPDLGNPDLVATPCVDDHTAIPMAPSSRKTMARTPYKQEMFDTLMRYLEKSVDVVADDCPLDCTISNVPVRRTDGQSSVVCSAVSVYLDSRAIVESALEKSDIVSVSSGPLSDGASQPPLALCLPSVHATDPQSTSVIAVAPLPTVPSLGSHDSCASTDRDASKRLVVSLESASTAEPSCAAHIIGDPCNQIVLSLCPATASGKMNVAQVVSDYKEKEISATSFIVGSCQADVSMTSMSAVYESVRLTAVSCTKVSQFSSFSQPADTTRVTYSCIGQSLYSGDGCLPGIVTSSNADVSSTQPGMHCSTDSGTTVLEGVRMSSASLTAPPSGILDDSCIRKASSSGAAIANAVSVLSRADSATLKTVDDLFIAGSCGVFSSSTQRPVARSASSILRPSQLFQKPFVADPVDVEDSVFASPSKIGIPTAASELRSAPSFYNFDRCAASHTQSCGAASSSAAKSTAGRCVLRPSSLQSVVASLFHLEGEKFGGSKGSCDAAPSACAGGDSNIELDSFDCSGLGHLADDTDICIYYSKPIPLPAMFASTDVRPSFSPNVNGKNIQPILRMDGSSQNPWASGRQDAQNSSVTSSYHRPIGEYGFSSAFQRVPLVCNIVPRLFQHVSFGARKVTGEKDLIQHSANANRPVPALDAEVALYSKFAEIGERFRKSTTEARQGASNPVASLLSYGDSKHFVPVWC